MSSRTDVNRNLGMAGLVHRFAVVMRTLLAVVAIVMITGIFPAMASLGSCAVKPCCVHEKADLTIAAHPACCSETTAGSMTTSEPVTLVHRNNLRQHTMVSALAMVAQMPVIVNDQSAPHLTSRSPKRSPETPSILLI
jgi:hypothetical protein